MQLWASTASFLWVSYFIKYKCCILPREPHKYLTLHFCVLLFWLVLLVLHECSLLLSPSSYLKPSAYATSNSFGLQEIWMTQLLDIDMTSIWDQGTIYKWLSCPPASKHGLISIHIIHLHAELGTQVLNPQLPSSGTWSHALRTYLPSGNKQHVLEISIQ